MWLFIIDRPVHFPGIKIKKPLPTKAVSKKKKLTLIQKQLLMIIHTAILIATAVKY